MNNIDIKKALTELNKELKAAGISDVINNTLGGANLTASNANGTGLSYTTGLIGQAFRFDGTDDYMSSVNSGFITGTAARSFSFWNKHNNVGSEQGIFFYGANTETYTRLRTLE